MIEREIALRSTIRIDGCSIDELIAIIGHIEAKMKIPAGSGKISFPSGQISVTGRKSFQSLESLERYLDQMRKKNNRPEKKGPRYEIKVCCSSHKKEKCYKLSNSGICIPTINSGRI